LPGSIASAFFPTLSSSSMLVGASHQRGIIRASAPIVKVQPPPPAAADYPRAAERTECVPHRVKS
jgi:hypothetical protein